MGSKMASASRVVQVKRFGRLSAPRAVGMVLTIAKALGRKGGGGDCAAPAALSTGPAAPRGVV